MALAEERPEAFGIRLFVDDGAEVPAREVQCHAASCYREEGVKRQHVEVTVFNGVQYEGEFPPSDARGFMSWLNTKVAEIPPEFMCTARIEIRSVGGYYGEHSPGLEITYTKPETEEQQSSRLAREKRAIETDEARERDLLAKLEAKYRGRTILKKGTK